MKGRLVGYFQAGLSQRVRSASLALSIAGLKEDWLGMPVEHGTVFCIDEEAGRKEMHRRTRLLVGDNLALVGHTFLPTSHLGLKLDDKAWLAELLAMIEERDPVLVILDSWVRVQTIDENSSREVNWLYETALKPLSKTTHNVTTLLCDHPPKEGFGQMYNPTISVRGSGDKLALVDRAWNLNRVRDVKNVVTLNNPFVRAGEEHDPITVRRVFTGDRMYHEVVGEGANVAEELSREADVDHLFDYLRRQPGGRASREEVVEQFSGGEGQAKWAISRAMAVGLIVGERDSDDRRKRVYRASLGPGKDST